MKKLNKLGVIAIVTAMTLCGCSSETNKDIKTVGLVQMMEHSSLNTIRESFMDEMKVLGYEEGKNIKIDYKNGQGDQNTINSIVSTFKGNKDDVIVAIATPTAQAAANVAKDIPVVFSAVSDPIKANLVTTLEKPDKNITGTSDEIQVEKIIDLMIKVKPDMKTIGFMYNKGEINSVSNIERAKTYAKTKGLAIEETSVASVTEVEQAAQVLASKSDAIFVPNDNTIASSMDVINRVMIKTKKPVFVGADSMVETGGFATIGINYEELGRETARMVDKILKGETVANIPVKVFNENLYTYINEDVTKQLGIQLPKEILNDKMTKQIKTQAKN
ncbi:MAG: ABC transporter substrate-binding protein [Erysipelotrichaceae bacterium]